MPTTQNTPICKYLQDGYFHMMFNLNHRLLPSLFSHKKFYIFILFPASINEQWLCDQIYRCVCACVHACVPEKIVSPHLLQTEMLHQFHDALPDRSELFQHSSTD